MLDACGWCMAALPSRITAGMLSSPVFRLAATALAPSDGLLASKPLGAATPLALDTADTMSDRAASQSLGAAMILLAVGIRRSSSEAWITDSLAPFLTAARRRVATSG